eukprot:579580-Rhodomonas_salina.1
MVTLFENNTFASSIGSTTVPDLCSNGVRALRHACFSSTSPQMQLAAIILHGIVFAICSVRFISWSVVSRGKEAWRGCCCTRKTPPSDHATLGAQVTKTNLLGLISSCTGGSPTACAAVEEADTSTITDMSFMFYGSSFTEDLSQWDVTSVTDMSYIFDGADALPGPIGWRVTRSALDDLIDGCERGTAAACSAVENADTSRITDMVRMFFRSSFTGNIANWDVSAVNDMRGMFSGSSFNGNIANWDVSAVNNMAEMFS